MSNENENNIGEENERNNENDNQKIMKWNNENEK